MISSFNSTTALSLDFAQLQRTGSSGCWWNESHQIKLFKSPEEAWVHLQDRSLMAIHHLGQSSLTWNGWQLTTWMFIHRSPCQQVGARWKHACQNLDSLMCFGKKNNAIYPSNLKGTKICHYKARISWEEQSIQLQLRMVTNFWISCWKILTKIFSEKSACLNKTLFEKIF